jgi:putative glutamine amidotransferase
MSEHMPGRPRIAVILDENTSGDATRYELSKNYFLAVRDAGGLPFGIPYLTEMVDVVVREFDGVLSVGGRFAFPDEWYLPGEVSKAPPSERFSVEQAIVHAYLDAKKPVLGICAGMQLLACLNGSLLAPDLRAFVPNALDHDRRGQLHKIRIKEGSKLAEIIGKREVEVNTFHREAVVQLGDGVIDCAHADDGVVEAIEVSSHPFAVGLQWHQELFATAAHPANNVFRAFVSACSGK